MKQNAPERKSRALLILDSRRKPIFQTNASDYKNLYTGSQMVADKTCFVMDLCDMGHLVRITLPRRMGKTMLLTMAKSFFELPGGVKYGNEEIENSPNYKLFKDTLIFEDAEFVEDCFGAFPTVYLTLRNVSGENFEKFLNTFAAAIQNVYEEFSYLQEKDEVERLDKKFIKKVHESKNELTEVELQYSISKLSEMLYRYHDAKVYVLIDDYDWPLNTRQSSLSNEEWAKIWNFHRLFLSTTLFTNEHLERGIVAGTMRISSDITYDECNLAITNNISRYFGFSESLVKELVKKIEDICGMNFDEEHLKLAKDWYNGFYFDESGEEERFYNPYSMASFLRNYPSSRRGALRCYWALESATIDNIEDALKRTEIAKKMKLIMEYTNGNSKENAHFDLKDLFTSRHYQILQKLCLKNNAITKESIDIGLSFLCHLGYIALNGGSPIIPNIEQRIFLEQKLME